MFQRTVVYQDFLRAFPNAQFVALSYGNGFAGEVAIGEVNRVATVVFAGIYKPNGETVGEKTLTDADVAPATLQGHDIAHAFKVAANLAESIANSVRNP
ncbi:hypothetical protein HGO40_11165 [Pseudomonas sp. CG7]|uniref:hypothetical protein n=1 Tax=Pseudomonas sp. CG7 TaxID=191007 RepID=UPI002033D19A|nr:hypothetical protein [Pseudomonas sp. CG7]MCM2461039.1 hypothetical protein [Pseudomonas sp. CG7]